MSNPVQIVWAAVVLFGFGSGSGTYLHRVSRLPSCFWLPCVSIAACAVAYALFYVSLFSPDAGHIGAWICWFGSVALFVRACLSASIRQMLRQRDAWLPVVLTALLTMSYLGSVLASDAVISYRFRFPMPIDNILPQMLADRVNEGSYGAGVPAMQFDERGWRFSDRPPLQAALVLAARPLQRGDGDRFYQFAATLCQMGWVAAVYALGRASALPRRYLQFVLIALAGSPFFFFNSVYTWPKLLAAWLCITSLAIVIDALRDRDAADAADSGLSPWKAVIAAGAAMLGMLSHGGVAFSVLALPVLVVWWRPWRIIGLRAAMSAAVVGGLLLAPWIAWQRLHDPPGNRLLKIHLAGVENVDARGTWEAIRETYGAMTWHDYLAGRWANVRQQWFGSYPAPIESAIDWVQWQQLMRHVPMIGVLLVGYLLLLWAPARSDLPEWPLRITRQLVWYALLTMTIWIVVMITPSSAMIHQGSYVMTSLLLYGAAVLVAALPRPVRWTVLALHLVIFATCYFFSSRIATPTPLAWRWQTAARAGVMFVAFLVAVRAVPEPTAPAAD